MHHLRNKQHGRRGLRDLLAGRGRRRGFTLIEILVAVIIIVIGLVGVMAMQIVAIQANATARDTSEATVLAEQFVTLLQQDATAWTEGNDLSQTVWLKGGIANMDQWQVVTADEMVNGMGVPRSALHGLEAGRARFCVAYRLRTAVPNEALSGFVRVYWQRLGDARAMVDCGTGSGSSLSASDLDTTGRGVHMVTLPVTVRRTHAE